MSDSILGGNFTVYYLADNNRKQIKWSGSVSGTNTVNQLHSALQSLLGELNQMDDGTATFGNTPVDYKIGCIDQTDNVPWFIDDETIQHLSGGSLVTSKWTRITGTQPGIVKVLCSANTSIVYGDIGNTITNGTSYGILLDMRGSGANTVLFIRPTDSAYAATTAAAYASTSDWTTSSATITCNSHTAVAATSNPAFTGEVLWANLYSLGTLAVDKGNNPITDVYIYRAGAKLTALSSGVSSYPWWSTGGINILVKVKEQGGTTFTGTTANSANTVTGMNINAGLLRIGQVIYGPNIPAGTTVATITSINSITMSNNATGTNTLLYTNNIDGSYVSIYPREYGNTFAYSVTDANAGGQIPISLNTGGDIANLTGTRMVTASAGSGTFSVGEILYTGASLSAATAKGVVSSVAGTGATSVIKYYLIGNLTDLTVTITGAVSGATITAGVIASNSDAGNPASLTGISVNTNINGYALNINNGNGVKYYSTQIDPGVNAYALSKVFEYTKYLNRRGSVDTANNNGITGESFIGIDNKLTYTTLTGSQIASGTVILQLSSGALGTVVTHDLTNKVIVLRNSRGTFGTGAITDGTNSTDAGTSVSAIQIIAVNPYGTFAGGKFFAAPGVCFNLSNLASSDIQAYQLTPLDGSTQVPPNVVYVNITGLLSGDSASIFTTRTISGVVDKATYTMPTVATTGGSAITVTSGTRTAIGSDEPFAGYLKTVKSMGGGVTQESMYRYASWAGTTFTLTPVTTGQNAILTATAAQYWNSGTNSAASGGNLLLVTLGTAISTSQVLVGDSVYTYATGTPGTALSSGTILKIVDTTHIWVRVNGTVTLANWSGIGNSIAYNVLVSSYSSSTDKVYVPIINYYATSGGTVTNSLIYSADISGLLHVRQYRSITPFEQPITIGSTGLTASTIRNADTIVT